jgi:trimethylamine--corrinoid protein Co-methyltransferase
MSLAYNLKPFTKQNLENIHQNSLKILAEIGVKLPNKTIQDLFRSKGAQIDTTRNIVRMPPELVEGAVQTQIANNRKYYNKRRNYSLPGEQIRGWMSLGNLGMIADYQSQTWHKGQLRDVLESIVLANQLPFIERVTCFVEPQELDRKIIDVVYFYLLSLYSAKRFFLVPIYSLQSAKCLIEMAKVIADDELQLRDGSLIEYELEPVANLEFAPDHLEIALEFAKHKLKILVGHYCLAGKDSPMDYESAITLTNANILAAISIVILLNPDHFAVDYIFAAHGIKGLDNPRPLFGSPNQVLFAIAARQLADFYGFRNVLANTALSDSCRNDFQSGFERGVTAAAGLWCGNTGLGLQGIAGADQAVSQDELVIDNAQISYLDFIFRIADSINTQVIDLESIEKVGIGGSFLARPETVERMKDVYWDSPVFSAQMYENWRKHEDQDELRARLVRNKLVSDNFPPIPVVSDDTIQKLDMIIQDYIQEEKQYQAFQKLLRKALQREVDE